MTGQRIVGCSVAVVSTTIGLSITGCGRSEAGRTFVVGDGVRPYLASAAVGALEPTDAASVVALQRLSTIDQEYFYLMAISPSGRHLSLHDWSTADLALRDLKSGETHLLTHARSDEYPSGEWEEAGTSVFSPDGRHIAYVWHRSQRGAQIRLIDLDLDAAGIPRPAEPRVVFENQPFAPYYLFDWSPDGNEILVLGYPSAGVAQLALISATGGRRTVLKSFDWREPLRAAFSPDGRYVAYDHLPDIDSPNRDVYALSLDGTQDVKVIDGPAIDRLLGWHADGSILFHSDRGGTPGVWRIAMSEGRPAGPPELVKADMWGIEPIGLTGSSLYYGVNVNPERFYTAPIDLETGLLARPPESVDDPARIRIRAWDWSGDGRLLAYVGAERATGTLRPSMVVIQDDRGEVVQTIRLDIERPSRLRWAPDRRSLIAWARDGKGRRGFYRIDLESGSYSTLVRAEEVGRAPRSGHFDISPDGETIWFARRDVATSPRPLTLIAYNLADGTSRKVAPLQHSDEGFVSVSPDGRRLAIVAPDSRYGTISTIPATGGPATPLYEIPEDVRLIGLDWTRDGASIVFSTSHSSEPWKTSVVPASGGVPRPLELGDHLNPRELSLRPDGAWIGFLAGESRGEIWMMDGLGRRTADAEEVGR